MKRAPGVADLVKRGMPFRGSRDNMFQTPETVRAACHGIGFHLLSAYNEETGHDALCRISSCSSSLFEYTIEDVQGCDTEALDAARSFIHSLVKPLTPVVKANCETSLSDQGRSVNALSHSIVDYLLRSLGGFVSRLVAERNEYFILVTWAGDVISGMGEEYAIRLPLVRGVAFIHTHPGGYCYPSHQDILSAIDFFSEGGIVEVIASRPCMLVLRLERPLSEHDYWQLQDIANCISKAREFAEYNQCIQMLSRLETVDAAMYSSSWLG